MNKSTSSKTYIRKQTNEQWRSAYAATLNTGVDTPLQAKPDSFSTKLKEV